MTDISIFKDIRKECIEKFGHDISVTIEHNIYPITSQNNCSVKISVFELKEDGGDPLIKDLYISAPLNQLPAYIINYQGEI